MTLTPLHRFMLRNADLLSVEQIAGFLGVSAEQVGRWIADMGLPESDPLPPDRAFPIVLRRNHDLLSYGDLSGLLGMTESRLLAAMQEMDFLDIKLGPKPPVLPGIAVCDDAEWASGADAFRKACSQYLARADDWEPRFGFLDELSVPEELNPYLVDLESHPVPLRMMYSYTGTHGDFLLTGDDLYREGILSRLQNRTVNAVWMPVLVRDLVPSGVFPEFGEGHEIRLANLRRQVERAAEYGISIYLYLNEPRFMPDGFFDEHPTAKGMTSPSQPGYSGMCTSDAGVREWLFESIRRVFSAIPNLGGILAITASENRTNCYSHAVPGEECPRCKERGPEAVLSDLANIAIDAIKASGSAARVIQWLWGWDFIVTPYEVKNAISSLSDGVEIMVDWARYTTFAIGGKEACVIEYTLAYTSPSDFAMGIIWAARYQGRKVHAKCAISTTVEANALPYMPLMENVSRLLNELKRVKVDGILGCWIFGAYPGRNMELLVQMPYISLSNSLAFKYYGVAARDVLAAWKWFSEGMAYFPTTVGILYNSALNPGPGLRLSLDPEPWRFGMAAMATERVEEISQPFGARRMISAFRRVARYFAEGLESLWAAIGGDDRLADAEENLRDYGIAKAMMLHLLTAANYTEFVLLRNEWLADKENLKLRSKLVSLLEHERDNAEAMLQLTIHDSRIGYEGSIGYFYTPTEIIEKLWEIDAVIGHLGGLQTTDHGLQP